MSRRLIYSPACNWARMQPVRCGNILEFRHVCMHELCRGQILNIIECRLIGYMRAMRFGDLLGHRRCRCFDTLRELPCRNILGCLGRDLIISMHELSNW